MNQATTASVTLAKRKHKSPFWRWTKTQAAKQTFAACRWLHVYISTLLFSLLFFFSVTGITLNHADWISNDNAVLETEWKLETTLVQRLKQQQVLALPDLQSWVNNQLSLSKPRSIDADWELGEVSFDYPIPAGYVFVTVVIDDELAFVESKNSGLLALLNDLHKGRHSGTAWSWLIDISALLICVFSITGIAILLQHKRYRAGGSFAILAGTLAPLLIYLWLAPRFSLTG